MAISYTAVSLTKGQTYGVNASNQKITGADGVETVVISTGFWNTVISGAVERVTLGVSLFATHNFTSKGQLIIASPLGNALTITPAPAGTQLTYADGSVATVNSSSSGNLSMHYDILYLPVGANINVPNGDVVIHGASGKESIRINSGLHQVVVDAAVEQIYLGFAFSPLLLSSGTGKLVINDNTGLAVAQLGLTSGQTETLNFTNARVKLGLDKGGSAIFTLTDLVLDANQSYSATQSNLHLYGNHGVEAITLSNSVTNVIVSGGVERVAFPSAYTSYTVKLGVSDVQVFNASNTLVADVFAPRNTSGLQLQFANDVYTAGYTNGILGLSVSKGAPSTTTVAPTASGVSGLQYTVSWGSFSSGQSAIEACLKKALADLSKYFNAKGVLDLQILPESVPNSTLAETMPTMVRTGATTQSTEFQMESKTGVDINGSDPDAVIYINIANLARMNLDPSITPTPTQFDLTTVLEHELLHALGFTGDIGGVSNLSTPYDNLIRFTNGLPYFVGTNAQALYGGPVPLAPASAGSGSAYYHINVTSDLMNESVGLGQVRTVSKLDLAMLQDIGEPILVGVTPSGLI